MLFWLCVGLAETGDSLIHYDPAIVRALLTLYSPSSCCPSIFNRLTHLHLSLFMHDDRQHHNGLDPRLISLISIANYSLDITNALSSRRAYTDMPQRKRKRLRGSESSKKNDQRGSTAPSRFDLWLQMPKQAQTQDLESKLVVRKLLKRLEATGYTHAALTHTVFGRPRVPEDRVETVLPESIWEKDSTKQARNSNAFRVLRRLHAVVENLSDVGFYAIKADDASSLLEEYDVVSIAPRNDAAFQACCVSATAAEIITLDYTSGRGGVQLPFRIRTTDVRAAVERRAVFEIPYAPGILNPNQRKALVQTCRELQMASLGVKAKVIFSSGDRIEGQTDVGAMALRTPGDLVNLMESVLRFDSGTSQDALTSAGAFVLEQGRKRRFGESLVSDIYIDSGTREAAAGEAETSQGVPVRGSKPISKQEPESIDEEVVEDGFISL
jgi:RNase P/RNase MRP subunit p30